LEKVQNPRANGLFV
jgi:coupling of ubiquitin conjugation to ER degradation protein 1